MLQQLNKEQLTVGANGKVAPTPHISIRTKTGTVKIGTLVSPQNKYTFTGVMFQSNKPKDTVLYPVDTGKLDRTYTYSYNINGKVMSGTEKIYK